MNQRARSLQTLFVVMAFAGLGLVPIAAQAQARNVEALGLVREAMDLYSNLSLDQAKAKLEQAVTLSAELDKSTLARVYVSLGVLWIGGFADNAKGQQNFVIAKCLDATVMVDPLLSTPDIDMVFALAQSQANPATCPQTLATVVVPGMAPQPQPGYGYPQPQPGYGYPPPVPAVPQFPECGIFTPPGEQKQKTELPFYLELQPQMMGRVAKLSVKYAFDASPQYIDLPLQMVGNGYGAMITCDEGQIRIFDPATIAYFIEGYDLRGQKICGHGSKEMPLEVRMMPEVAIPLEGLPGMAAPKECVPCPPWDETCGRKEAPGVDQRCDEELGCAEGLRCNDDGFCEPDEGGGGPSTGGPATFYVNLSGGTGFGYVSQKIDVSHYNTETELLEVIDDKPAGFAWSGVPLRLALGFFITPELSLELSGRFDVYVTYDKQDQSCWDAAGEKENRLDDVDCSEVPGTNRQPINEKEARESVALTADSLTVQSKTAQVAWMANIRARYIMAKMAEEKLRLSLFGGVGYGYSKYRVETADGVAYFPMAGMVDIEVGPALAYYFTDNVGFIAELPIDFFVGNGFAFNIDVQVGLSFGF